jgi:type IV pilus assembly protein PilY1
MYDLAYIDTSKHCYDDSYNAATTYAGYCDPTIWYIYDLGQSQFEEAPTWVTAETHLAGAGGTRYQNASYVGIAIDETVTPNEVKGLVAIGNFVNWVTASKFDIEKKILTGGKLEATGTYGAPNDRLVMETRGCLNKRLVKQVTMKDHPAGVNTYYLTLGVGGSEEETFPEWENATAYVIGDVVTDMTDLYRATSNGTSSGTGVVDDAGVSWQAYTRTRWTAGAVYPANSIVSDDGEMYITAGGGTTCALCTGVDDDGAKLPLRSCKRRVLTRAS